MSWHYSRALVAAYSAASCSDGKPSAPSNGTPTHGMFWSPDKTTDASKPSRSGMMFRPSTDAHGEALLTWCLEASRAKTSAQPGKVPASKASEAVCGNTWRESSAKFCLASSSWKTHRCLWEEDLEWSSLTLPQWGMMRSGVLWERITPPRLTSGTESGSWPTPRKSPGMASGTMEQVLRTVERNGYTSRLEEAVALRWATPQARDFRTGSTDRWDNPERSRNLNDQIGGQLNPNWVEWLMGWPLGWTDCAASATAKFQEWCHSHGISYLK